MYYQYFGLNEAPFSIAVNPRYLFMSPRHRDALAHLLYGVGAGDGFILLTGEVGTGKTTINRCLLEQIPSDTDVAIILNPALNAIELLASVCDELGVDYDHLQHTLKSLTDQLHNFLLENHARGRKTVLLIDEAQHLDFDVLEQIRLLTNLETNSEKLLQIILIGQPELAQMLVLPELRQLNQRITARYNLGPLNLDETGAYIQHRLQVAGMNPERVIFAPSVVQGIHKVTRGIPRVINVLCDRLLLGAYGRNKSRVDHDMLKLAAQEVLGEPYAFRPTWRWLLVAAAVGLLVWGGGWLLGNYSAAPAAGSAPIEGQEPAAAVASEPLVAAATSPIATREAETPELIASAPVQESASVAPVVNALQPEVAEVLSVMLSPREVLAELWVMHSLEPVPEAPCSMEVQSGLACFEGEALIWDELVAIDRPLALETITPENVSTEVLLLGIAGSNAWVLAVEGVTQVKLAELAPYWSGRYRFLWRVPDGFETSLMLGQESDAVAEVARWFARMDGQAEPLAGRRFNRALQQRVRLFQQEQSLVGDGVVGVQTLLKLNGQPGMHVTAAQARLWLQDATSKRSEQ
jgi:general secretion pathway protein A